MLNSMINQTKESKSPSEIRETIESALQTNEILGFLKNNILYMKSFGRNSTPDKIIASIGFVLFYIGMPEKDIPATPILLWIGGTMFAIGTLVAYLVKHYLIYDLDREVFYTITNLWNITIFRSKEIEKRNIAELGVDVTDKAVNNDKLVDHNALHFKGELIDNPGLRTSLVGLSPEGKILVISDPLPKKQPHEVAIARCKLFADCFGVKSVICEKSEYLTIDTDEFGKKTFGKKSRIEEWEKLRIKETKTNYIILAVVLVVFALILAFVFLS